MVQTLYATPPLGWQKLIDVAGLGTIAARRVSEDQGTALGDPPGARDGAPHGA